MLTSPKWVTLLLNEEAIRELDLMPTTILEFHQMSPGEVFVYGGRKYQKVDEQFAKIVPASAEPNEEKSYRFYPESIVSAAGE